MSDARRDREPEPTEFTVVLPPLDTEEQRDRHAKHLRWLVLKYQMNRLWAMRGTPIFEFIEADLPFVVIDPPESTAS
jgi:hypothetical protein